MRKKIFIFGWVAIGLAGAACGGLDRIYEDAGWKVEKIITDTAFSAVVMDQGGTLYMARTAGGLGAAWGSAGQWTVRPDLGASAGTGKYSHIDVRSANHLFMIDGEGLERTYYGSGGWTNQEMAVASYAALAVDRSQPSYYIAAFMADSSGGLDRQNFYKGHWKTQKNICETTNIYADVESKPGDLNHAFMVGAAGLERTWYTYGKNGGWKHEIIIPDVSLTSVTVGKELPWSVFAAKAGGGLMQAYRQGKWKYHNMSHIGASTIYVDLMEIPGEAHSLFMLTDDGTIEKAWWLGSGKGWTNEVIVANGNYTAFASGGLVGELFAVSESKTRE